MLTTSIALYALTPKVDFKRKINNTNRFFTNDDWQRGRFENFESDHHYESNLESDVRFKIESNHEASQVPTFMLYIWLPVTVSSCSKFELLTLESYHMSKVMCSSPMTSLKCTWLLTSQCDMRTAVCRSSRVCCLQCWCVWKWKGILLQI